MNWNPYYLGLIVLSTSIDYLAALKIRGAEHQESRKLWLLLSIATNLGILFTFKYFNFFIDSAEQALSLVGIYVRPIYLELILPVGISFYTFQTMSYTIDVYKRVMEPEKHFGYFALYVAFFPQLVAGPIERAKDLLPQFKRKATLTMDDIYIGLNRIAYGFFKKVVIADRLSFYVGNVFSDIEHASFITILIGAFFFLIQVYCDFSGYSDIAFGTAMLLGIKLTLNFQKPFIATSLTEYWRRWHVSLTNWVRDYIYIPLGGNRVTTVRWYFNIIFAFTIMGLWHGANWTYIVWGLMHGVCLVAENVIKPQLLNIPLVLKRAIGWFLVMLIFTVSMIFFRAENIIDASIAISKVFTFTGECSFKVIKAGINPNDFYFNCVTIIFLGLSYLLPKSFKFKYNLLFLVCTSIIILIAGTYEKIEFVYFQF